MLKGFIFNILVFIFRYQKCERGFSVTDYLVTLPLIIIPRKLSSRG